MTETQWVFDPESICKCLALELSESYQSSMWLGWAEWHPQLVAFE